jgi:hypothetical protein
MENGYRRGRNVAGVSSSGLGLRAGDWERGRGGGDCAGSVRARERSRNLDEWDSRLVDRDREPTRNVEFEQKPQRPRAPPRDMARDEWHGAVRRGPEPRFREDARTDARSREGGGRGGGRGAEERRGGSQPNARQLTGAIKNCRGVGELARILREQRGVLNHIHVTAAWGCLARIGTGRGAGDVR